MWLRLFGCVHRFSSNLGLAVTPSPRTAPSRRPTQNLRSTAPLALALALALPPVGHAQTPAPVPPNFAPEATLASQSVWLEAPEAALLAYLDTFSHRQWFVGVGSHAEYLDLLRQCDLTPAAFGPLSDPAIARPLADGSGLIITPPLSALQPLSLRDRRVLYRLLAFWPPNKPERWPIVFSQSHDYARLAAEGVPAAVVNRLRELSYPFRNGFAFSDFSVLAAEFPDRALLLNVLRASSLVHSRIPRINLRTAQTVVQVLDYWTVDRRNTFAQPLLEALLDSETQSGVELLSILPSSTRVLSNDLGPEDVKHDFSYVSHLMAISVAYPVRPQLTPANFRTWFDSAYDHVSSLPRYGDVLTVESDDDCPIAYACAYLADDLVFAKDPVGLGLWRFMTRNEVLQRNPHFDRAHFSVHRVRSSSPPPATEAPPRPDPATLSSPGPWGVLRYERIRLTPPQDILDQMVLPSTRLWGFGDLDWPQIDALFAEAGLSSALRATLADPALRATTDQGRIHALRVPDALRQNLTPAERASLYRRLAAFEQNVLHRLPFVLPSDEIIDRAQLNPPLRTALLALSYPRLRSRCIADADLLEPLIRDAAELQRLKRLLFSVPSLSVELTRESIATPALRTATLAYWANPTNPTSRPVLQAFARSDSLASIDLLNLLPPLAQRVINSFPDRINTPRSANCFWTSLNFSNVTNDDSLLPNSQDFYHSGKTAQTLLQRDYDPVSPPYRLGDVLAFTSLAPRAGELIHAMVYLADDLVLTKNGAGQFSPFSLSRLSEVEQIYAWAFDLEMQGYRKRLPPTPALPPAP